MGPILLKEWTTSSRVNQKDCIDLKDKNAYDGQLTRMQKMQKIDNRNTGLGNRSLGMRVIIRFNMDEKENHWGAIILHHGPAVGQISGMIIIYYWI